MDPTTKEPTSEKPAAPASESGASPAPTADTGRPEVADGRSAGSPSDEDWKQKYLQAKEAEERANRLQRELDEAKARQSVSPPPTTTAADPLAQLIQNREQEMEPLYQLAKQGDETARREWNAWVLQRDYMLADQAQKRALVELLEVPDGERPKVRELLTAGKFRSAKDALEHLRAAERSSKLTEREAELERLRKENEELKAERERRERGAPSTGRGLPPSATGGSKPQPKTVSEANELLERLNAEGREAERYDLSRRMRKGDLKNLPVA